MHGVNPAAAKQFGDDDAGNAFAVGGNGVGRAGRHLPHHGEAADQLAQLVEMFADFALDAERFGDVHVAKLVQLIERTSAVATDGCGRDREQLVGGFAHRRHNYYRMAVNSSCDNSGDSLNSLAGLDRRPAKFHDNHKNSISHECTRIRIRVYLCSFVATNILPTASALRSIPPLPPRRGPCCDPAP